MDRVLHHLDMYVSRAYIYMSSGRVLTGGVSPEGVMYDYDAGTARTFAYVEAGATGDTPKR